MRLVAPTTLRQHLLCAAALGLVILTSPFPLVQGVFHMILVVALAPRPGSPLATALWAAAAGWCVEGSLRLYPHMGGTPWADMSLALFAGWQGGRWPVETLKSWIRRLGALALLQVVLVEGALWMAAGPHPWTWGWTAGVLTVPLWGWLSWRLLRAGTHPVRL